MENKISVTMISNAMNHHQYSFCDSMFKENGIDFHFIATKPISEERLKTGFKDLNSSREYIIRAYDSPDEQQRAFKIAQESDFVIYGSAPFSYIKERLKNKKWTFIYSERLFKETRAKDMFNIKTILACMLRYFFVSHEKLRLLCSSAYSSNDFKFFRFKVNQTYKWGYFTPKSNLSLDEIENKKEPASIIWVGRMIHLKHPEYAIELARRLKENGIDFKLKMVGDGPMLSELKATAETYGLIETVEFLGVLDNADTREEMEKSAILITTSDHNEGWGAIVNEGMASGCAVVASHLMGSAPFLISDGENGYLFESGNLDDLAKKIKFLLESDERRKEISKNGFNTITNQYNGEVAAKRLAELIKRCLSGETAFAFESGICSHAEYLKNNWYKNNL